MDFKKGIKIGIGVVFVQYIVGFIAAMVLDLARGTDAPKAEAPEE